MKTLTILLFVFLTLPVFALEDTIENRTQQVDRYFAERPTKELLEYSVELTTKNMLPQRREAYKLLYYKYLDIDAITKDMKDLMVKDFKADEIKALADFCETPQGKSVMKKMMSYYLEAAPMLKTELEKAKEKMRADNPQTN